MDARLIAGIIVIVIIGLMLYLRAKASADPVKVAAKAVAVADAKKAIIEGKAKLDAAKKLDIHKDKPEDKKPEAK